MNGRIDKWTDRRTDRQTDGQTDGRWRDGQINPLGLVITNLQTEKHGQMTDRQMVG
jgi:hypothetical protein